MLLFRKPWDSQPHAPLDLGNTLNSHVVFAWSAVSPALSLVGQNLSPTNATKSVRGEGIVSALSAGYWVKSSYAPIVTSDGAGNGDFSVLVRANTAAVATAQILFSQRLNSGAFPQLSIIANSTGGGSASSGRIEFLTFNGTLVGSSVASRVNGAFHSWLMVRNGTSLSLWEDGQQISSTSGTIQTVWNSGSGLGLGANYHAGLPSTCDLSFAWASNRSLSDSEAAALSGDYKIAFEPRRIWVPVSVSSGPTYTLTASGGAYTHTGGTAGLAAGRKIVAAGGSYTHTGGTAALQAGRKLAASGGAFAETGGTAGLVVGRKIAADGGAYAFTGGDANLVYTPVGGATYTLSASGGTFALTGGDVAFLAARKLVVDGGAFALSGGDAAFTYPYDTAVPSKVGGDDVPRIEIYEKRKKKKRKDETLEAVIRNAMRGEPVEVKADTRQIEVELLALQIEQENEDLLALIL